MTRNKEDGIMVWNRCMSTSFLFGRQMFVGKMDGEKLPQSRQLVARSASNAGNGNDKLTRG